MPGGISVITDQRYYVVNRTEFTKDSTRVALEDCDRVLQNAPTPKTNINHQGRRPHLHGDKERHYVEERIQLDPRLRYETGQDAVLRPEALPKLAAYPFRPFDYAGQNRFGKDSQGNAGYGRIITDSRKTQVGMSYRPLGEKEKMVRAEAAG